MTAMDSPHRVIAARLGNQAPCQLRKSALTRWYPTTIHEFAPAHGGPSDAAAKVAA
jgi:hypothetical protein